MKTFRTALCLSGLLWTLGSQAQAPQGQPSRGMAYNQAQPSAIKYECKPASESRIACSFTQLDVYKVQYPSAESSSVTSGPAMDEHRCAELTRELDEELKKDSAASPPPGRMRSEERRVEALKASVEYCKTGNRDALRAFNARELDRLRRKCTVSVHSYIQTFRRNPAGPDNQTRWTTENVPSGKCKLQREASFTSDGPSWTYFAQYKVMNKSAQQDSLRCGEIREQQSTYSSLQTEEAGLDCETVQFSDGCYSPDFPCLGGPPVVQY